MPTSLAVKMTCGTDAPERASQALTVAATAVASGAQVSLWLTGEAAWFAARDAEPAQSDLGLDHAAPATDLLATVLGEESADVVVCTQCAARRGLTEPDLLDGVRIAGAAAFVELVLSPDVSALVY